MQAPEKMSFYAAILPHTGSKLIKRTEEIILIGFGNLRSAPRFLELLPADIADISAEISAVCLPEVIIPCVEIGRAEFSFLWFALMKCA